MYLSEVGGEGGISSKVVAASVANGTPIYTLELNYPRFIHSEFMTHRVFSRNASSSRAIPVAKMIEQVWNNPAMPIHWGKNKAGMQADEEFDFVDEFVDSWGNAMMNAHDHAEFLSAEGVHKQVVNRILEPYQFIKVVVTATEWDNFFNLRLDKAAQPEIQELARVMKESMDKSTPIELLPTMYHLPYVNYYTFEQDVPTIEEAIKCSVARCARVSYLNHDNTNPDVDKDIALYDMLLSMGHMSPFEHCCTPMPDGEWPEGMTHLSRDGSKWSSNLRGWVMYRNLL